MNCINVLIDNRAVRMDCWIGQRLTQVFWLV